MLDVESEYAEKSFRENLTNSGLLTGNNKFIFSKGIKCLSAKYLLFSPDLFCVTIINFTKEK